MPHINTKTYPRAGKEYELEYVEVVSDVVLGYTMYLHSFLRNTGAAFDQIL